MSGASGTTGGAPALPYEPALDGLRAISIAGVLLFHACATSSIPGAFRGGGLGVSVFFTISGFLITSLLVRDIDQRGRVDLSRFWARRIRRLAPAALVVIAAVVVVGRTDWFDVRRGDVAAAVWSATNWRVISAGDPGFLASILGPLGPTWSLAVEEQFYVLLALLAVAVSRTARPARNLAVVFGAMVLGSIAVANLAADWGPRLEFGTDVRAAEIAVGGLLALAVRHRSVVGARALHGSAIADALGALGVGGIVVLFLVGDYTPPWLLRGGFTVVALTTAATIVGALAHRGVSTALSWSPVVALGRISYSLYLVHWPIILVLTEDRTGMTRWPLVALKAAASIVAAAALHVLVEQPVRGRTDLSTRSTVLGWLAASAAVTVLGVVLGS